MRPQQKQEELRKLAGILFVLKNRLKLLWALHEHLEKMLMAQNNLRFQDEFKAIVHNLKKQKLKDDIMLVLEGIRNTQIAITNQGNQINVHEKY